MGLLSTLFGAKPDDGRRELPRVSEGRPFPHGVRGLVPVETSDAHGTRTCYAFKTQDTADLLIDLCNGLNVLLDEAGNLIGREFAPIEKLWCMVPPADASYPWSFCYVEEAAEGGLTLSAYTPEPNIPKGTHATIELRDGMIASGQIVQNGEAHHEASGEYDEYTIFIASEGGMPGVTQIDHLNGKTYETIYRNLVQERTSSTSSDVISRSSQTILDPHQRER